MNEIIGCPKCNEEIEEQTWGNNPKTGKPYHAWRHKEKNPNCDFIDWIPEKKSYSKPASKPVQSALAKSEDYQNLLNANRKLYALILAVAHCLNIPQENIDAEIKRMEYQGK